MIMFHNNVLSLPIIGAMKVIEANYPMISMHFTYWILCDNHEKLFNSFVSCR